MSVEVFEKNRTNTHLKCAKVSDEALSGNFLTDKSYVKPFALNLFCLFLRLFVYSKSKN